MAKSLNVPYFRVNRFLVIFLNLFVKFKCASFARDAVKLTFSILHAINRSLLQLCIYRDNYHLGTYIIGYEETGTGTRNFCLTSITNLQVIKPFLFKFINSYR